MVRVQLFLAEVGRWLEYVLVAVCTLLLCFLVASVFIEVLIRYVIHAPSAWTEEVAQFILVWFGLLAAAVAARRGMHFALRFGVMYLDQRTRRIVRQFCNVAVILLLAVLLKQSIAYLDIVGNQHAMATDISLGIPYAGIPVGLGAIMLVYILEVADAVLSLWTGRSCSTIEAREEEVYRELRGETLPPTTVSQPH